MINLKILFGWVPKTTEYEALQEALRKEYSDLTDFSQSKELTGFLELEKTVLSPEFALRKKSIVRSRFSDTPEFSKEKEYLHLKKQKEIQRYYKLKDSVELRDFLEFDRSYDLKHFHTLENLVQSEDYARIKNELGRKKFKRSPEYEKFLEYKALKKSERIREYFAFKLSRDYVNFTLLIGSEKIALFEQLQKFVRSEEFKKVKEYMILPGRTKLELSEEFKMEQKYLELKKSDKFKWYFKTRNSNKFDGIKSWKLTFSDEFESHHLDNKKWLTRYFWGETLLHDSYVNEGEMQFFPGGQNIQVANSVLKIITRKQKYSGKRWNPAIGFYPHEFEYTAGIINSGGKFRQQYGLFEAKIRFNLNHPVSHAFWMISDLMMPHIDIARATKKIKVGSYFGNPNVKGGVDKRASSLSRNRYGSDFQIFSLEWSQDKLVWKINGVTIYSTTQGVPQVPMYVNMSSSLYQDVNGSVLPAEVDVDWIRCYKHM
jgi:beta-glucanase (GH16 family)